MNNIIIGLTGQTGAGKSTVSEMLSQMDCVIINADSIAREALEKNSDCLKRLAELFGYDIIDDEGNCRRRLLAQRAFSSPKNKRLLDKTTHPWIIRRTTEYIEAYRHSTDRPIVFDAPLLFESGGDKLCDVIISVTAPEELRLERIIRRDGLSVGEARLRMSAQHDADYYIQGSDYVIDGSQPLELVRRQAALVLENIIKRGVT